MEALQQQWATVQPLLYYNSVMSGQWSRAELQNITTAVGHGNIIKLPPGRLFGTPRLTWLGLKWVLITSGTPAFLA
jgi:hypothetical protein